MSRYRKAVLIMTDVGLVNLSAYLSLLVRFDGHIPARYLDGYLSIAPVHTALSIALFAVLGLYSWVLRYAGIDEVVATFMGSVGSAGGLFLLTRVMTSVPFPRLVPVVAGVFTLILSGGARMSVRLYFRISERLLKRSNGKKAIRVLIVGAGDAGAMLIRELGRPASMQRTAIALIDDDPRKRGALVQGVKILGGRELIAKSVKDLGIDEIIIAMPSAPPSAIKEIVGICEGLGVRLRAIPRLIDTAGRAFALNQVRDIDIEDLLGRAEVTLDTEKIRDYLSGKRVLVTGAGGSIGSEICRQVARYSPQSLIMLDHSENAIFQARMDLDSSYPDLHPVVVMADIRDSARVRDVFSIQRPHVVFHAAAHKHVSLMEENIQEAVKTNIFGTWNVARAALAYEAEKFVMISTDKAVNPTGVMGVTKRVAEKVVRAMSTYGSATRFVSVRFGNVLGSSGSVVPIFREQIAKGGPVTVTHPDMRRYFMTIREAVLLVLQAGTMGRGGEIFVLDMGEPVKIVDLAEQMIRLSGHLPHDEIPIVYTGMRPGEKLYEELLTAEEGTTATHHSQIFVATGDSLDLLDFESCLGRLESIVFPPDYESRLYIGYVSGDTESARAELAATASPMSSGGRYWDSDKDRLVVADQVADIVAILSDIVPSYRPSAEVRKRRTTPCGTQRIVSSDT